MSGPIRRLTEVDLPRLKGFWTEQWGGPQMIVHGDVIPYDAVDGFVWEDWEGVITFRITGAACEITSLDSLQPGHGVGTALIGAVVREAKARGCRRVFLVTTNDNLHALGYYQKRGFVLAVLHRGAVDESRKIKPSIPLVGENNIPLRDEIELELAI